MGNYSAFFYGTLMVPEVLYRVCYGKTNPEPWRSSLLTIKPAILHGFCRHKVRSCDYPAIIPQANTAVRGTFVTGLTEGDMYLLDIFEGDEYARKKVRARVLLQPGDGSGEGSEEGEEVETETYVWIAGEDTLEPGEWNFAEFVNEKLTRWAEEDEEYEEVDKAVQSQQSNLPGGTRAGVQSELDNINGLSQLN